MKISENFWITPSLHISQNVLISSNHIPLTHTDSIFTFCTNSFYYLVNSLSLPNFILIFISKNWFDSFSLIFWHAPILLDVILQALILCLHFFKCFALHYTIMASHKLIWIIVSGSSFQKLTSSTIILLTLTLRISISLLKNATLIKITKNVHHHLLRKHYEFFNHLTFNKIKTKF